MVEKHSELSGNTYAIFIPTLNPEEPQSPNRRGEGVDDKANTGIIE